MENALNITLPMPPSANRYWRAGNGRVFVSEEAVCYKCDVEHIFGRTKPLTGDIALTVRVYRKQKSGDLDNRLKVLIDALKGIAYEDDKQITEIHAFRFDDKADPRVEVEISEAI